MQIGDIVRFKQADDAYARAAYGGHTPGDLYRVYDTIDG